MAIFDPVKIFSLKCLLDAGLKFFGENEIVTIKQNAFRQKLKKKHGTYVTQTLTSLFLFSLMGKH